MNKTIKKEKTKKYINSNTKTITKNKAPSFEQNMNFP